MGRRIRRGGEESSFASQIYTCDFLNCENKSLKCESETVQTSVTKQTNESGHRDFLSLTKILTSRQPIKKKKK